jgi:phosphinothricin acetyltransferase
MSAPRFRYATLDDLPEIVRIYNSTIASRVVTADLEPISVESRHAWFAAHSPDKHPLWVIENEAGAMLGWLSLSAFYGRPAYGATAEISVYLDDKARGRGLGRIAVQYAEAACPALGIKTLLGFIFAHNVPSLKLFERLGYKGWAHLPNVAELDGVERSLDILGKRISA